MSCFAGVRVHWEEGGCITVQPYIFRKPYINSIESRPYGEMSVLGAGAPRPGEGAYRLEL